MAFCSTTLRSSDLREVYRTPGPAYYEVMHKDRSVSLGDPSFRSQLHRLDGLKSSNEVPGPGMYEHNVAPRADGKATWRQLRRGFALRHKTPPATPREDTVDQLYVAPTKAPARKLLCMVPKKEQRIVSRQAMKSLLCSPGESIPSLSQEQVCIWIGTDSTQVPVRRRKMLGKVFQPSSAFASGTSRRSEAEREGPGPASCAPEGFAELAERQRRHRAARRAPQAPQVPFGSTSTAREQPRGSPELGPGYYDLDVPLPETVRRSPSPAFGTQQQRFYRDRSETPGPADYARCGASAWEDASTAAPSGVEDSTTPPLAFGTRQDRACAMTSTPTLEERVAEDGHGRPGIPKPRVRNWILQARQVLSGQRPMALGQALLMWAQSFALFFKGVEDCPICYNVIQLTTQTIPRKACPTCKHKFHNECLYQWFRTSSKTTCPLCNQPF